MSKKDKNLPLVELMLELGHKASVKDALWNAPEKVTTSGQFTHDWEFYIKGKDNGRCEYYFEKVIFYLHDTFKNPTRVVREPPYRIQEQGYAGFNMHVEVYFKGTTDSDAFRKVSLTYDLFLSSFPPAEGMSRDAMKKDCRFHRLERIMIKTDNKDFIRNLLKGGGVLKNDGGINIKELLPSSSKHRSSSSMSTSSSSSRREKSHSSSSSSTSSSKNKEKERKADKERRKESSKSSSRSSSISREKESKKIPKLEPEKVKSKEVTQTTTPKSKPNDTFTILFGEPIQKDKKGTSSSSSSKKDKSPKEDKVKSSAISSSNSNSATNGTSNSSSYSSSSLKSKHESKVSKSPLPPAPSTSSSASKSAKSHKSSSKDRERREKDKRDKERREKRHLEKEEGRGREKEEKLKALEKEKLLEAEEREQRRKKLEEEHLLRKKQQKEEAERLERERREKELKEKEARERLQREKELKERKEKKERERKEKEKRKKKEAEEQKRAAAARAAEGAAAAAAAALKRKKEEEKERLEKEAKQLANERSKKEKKLEEEGRKLEKSKRKEKSKGYGTVLGILKSKEKEESSVKRLSDSDRGPGSPLVPSESSDEEKEVLRGEDEKKKRDKRKKKEKEKKRKRKERSRSPLVAASPSPVSPLPSTVSLPSNSPIQSDSSCRSSSSPPRSVSLTPPSSPRAKEEGGSSSFHSSSSPTSFHSSIHSPYSEGEKEDCKDHHHSPDVPTTRAPEKQDVDEDDIHMTNSFEPPQLVNSPVSPMSEDENMIPMEEEDVGDEEDEEMVDFGRNYPTKKSWLNRSPQNPHLLLSLYSSKSPVQKDHQEYLPIEELTGDYFETLKVIQERINNPTESDNIDNIVQIVQQTGCFACDNNEHFDFDLCLLDKSTIKKIQKYLGLK